MLGNSALRVKSVRFSNAIYHGTIQSKSLQGLGLLLFHCGHAYFGNFQNNQFHGVGILYYLNHMILHSNFQNGKINGHAILSFSKNVFYLLNFESGSLHGRQIKYNLKEKSKITFDSELGMVGSQSHLDPLKLFREINSFLKKLTIKNISFTDSERANRYQIGNFRLGPDRWLNGVMLNKKPSGFGIFHENKHITKFGYFYDGRLQGFSRIDFRGEISYFGVRKAGEFERECIMYVSRSNVFAQNYQSGGGGVYTLSKGVGLPFEKIFKLCQKSAGSYLCRFVKVDQYLSVDLLSVDYHGKFFIYFGFIFYNIAL